MFYIREGIPCNVLTNHTVSPNIEFHQISANGFSWVSINLQSKVIQNLLKKLLDSQLLYVFL